ncbi:MAG: glycosyl transferase [Proteobacteria bacterium]|nr:glycosyl transferase [Pseudomonadota bacterium]
MERLVFLLVGCLVLTWSVAHLYRVAALALQIVDTPNHRSAHRQATPTGAGIAFIGIFGLSLLLVDQSGTLSSAGEIFYDLLPPLLLVAAVGFVDDMKPLPWTVRAPVHLLAAGWIVKQLGFPVLVVFGVSLDLGFAGIVLGTLGLMWLLNLYNFMDGIDGIATAEAIFVLGSVVLLGLLFDLSGLSQPLLTLLACCFGFLLINWPKAKVFMGDGGSGFLGLILGSLLLAEQVVNPWVWLILLGWFITDTGLTILMRLARGEKVYEAHSQHAYQHLNRRYGTSRTLLLIGAINIGWLLPCAAVATIAQDWAMVLLGCACLPLLIFQYYCGAGRAGSS